MKNQMNTNSSFERSSKLPDEILGSHETRADFLKWKLILVAGLGAAGLGLMKDSAKRAELLLALIPLVCIYVDLLCVNLKVRVIVIGKFYADVSQDMYERYVQLNRDAFKTEDWALFSSTRVICAIVGGTGLLAKTFDMLEWKLVTSVNWQHPREWPWHHPTKEGIILVLSGLVGLFLSWYTDWKSKRLIKSLTSHRGENAEEVLEVKIAASYEAANFQTLCDFLMQKGVFIFQSLPNGLFSAAGSAGANDVSGYQYVWVRDNVHVAHAHYVCGNKASAGRALGALMMYFEKCRGRFRAIIEDREADPKKARAANPMNRPNVRFDGRKLEEVEQTWAHAQNDALGYFLWCYCKLAQDGVVFPDAGQLKCLADFPLYFEAIQYWQDADSGHWEETRKVSASSIGVVVAGLREFQKLIEKNSQLADLVKTEIKLDSDRLNRLRETGEAVLKKILPCESVEPEKYYRRYDGALLFLIYPLEVLSWDEAKIILEDVRTHLQGDYGIRRYLGDSYWFPDYKKIPAKKRTADFSENMAARDADAQLGKEAQWCIFDPIISVIYGRMHLICKREGRAKEAGDFLQTQTTYLNRSLSQLTSTSKSADDLRAPEAYYLENGRYTPNDHTPLLWTQANLWLAVNQMRQSLESEGQTQPCPTPTPKPN